MSRFGNHIDDLFSADAIDQHLKALRSEVRLPAISVAACAVSMEYAGPALLAALEKAAAELPTEPEDDRFLFRAIHILGGARIEEAFPPLMRLLALPADDVEGVLGDAVTETLSRIVAGVFNGDADAMFAAIENGSPDEFVRDALLGAATFLCWEGRIDPARMERFLETFLDEIRAPPDDPVWMAWVDAVGLLGLASLADRARLALRDGRISKELADESYFEELFAGAPHGAESFEKNHLGYLEDIVETLELFVGNDRDDPWSGEIADVLEGRRDAAPALGVPVVNPFRHVGRNDPCPCGSGLKAKKCCLA